jgi:hypothetical protein
MQRFLKYLFYFSVPVFVGLAIPLITLFSSGEDFMYIDKIIKDDKPYLIGYAYHENNYNYLKWKAVNVKERKVVLAIGSSRVLQFREKMFSQPFYNAGYTVKNIQDFIPFIKGLPKDKYPKYLILGIDQWMYRKNKEIGIKDSCFWENSFSMIPQKSVLKGVYQSYFEKNVKLFYKSSDENFQKIGLNAFVNGKGFRNDGSMNYGTLINKLINKDTTLIDFQFQDTFSRIKLGSKQFGYADSIDTNNLNELDHLLSFCKEQNIYVFGILPPFADKVNELLITSGHYKYMDEIYEKSVKIFNHYNFELWDMKNLSEFNSSDNEMLDGFHGSETTYLKLLINIANKGSKINEVIDIERIEGDLENKKNKLVIYD